MASISQPSRNLPPSPTSKIRKKAAEGREKQQTAAIILMLVINGLGSEIKSYFAQLVLSAIPYFFLARSMPGRQPRQKNFFFRLLLLLGIYHIVISF